MELLIDLSNKRLTNTSNVFKRYMIDEIDWSDRLISIVGGRGAGKTTMMLQNMKATYGVSSKALYISLDNIYFTRNLLSELADSFVKMGGEALYIDEVHKYPNWSIELKNIYDNYPELKVVFSGSSMLELYKGQGDLSRRLSSYSLSPLSFREFIELEHGVIFPKVSLGELLDNHIEIAHSVTAKIKPLAYFSEYLNLGAFPFFKDSHSKYHERLQNVVNMILDYDLPSITPIDYAHVLKMKMLLKIISEQVPYTPNISKLASQTEIDRKTVLKYLDLLFRGGLIHLLNTPDTSDSLFTKPDKIYLGNPNFMFSLCEEKPNTGTLRETFFCQQLSVKHKVHMSPKSDFLIDKRYTFEIGGKAKTSKQIEGITNSYIAADGIEYGFANRIPLWLFGFLY
jgi:hypothetical protein